MSEPRIVSLFSGYGGLEMGIQAVVGGHVIAHAEFDDAPSRILAHHWPDVPNLGDVTKINWTGFLDAHPELGDLFGTYRPGLIACGGFPCQDVSLAGLRRGLKDGTRSGLWSEFARAIDALRPELVVIENVRGLLSAEATGVMESDPWALGDGDPRPTLRALGAVLGDLADLGYDAEWCGVRAADAGAPHGRFRVFIVAYPYGVGRGSDVGDLFARQSDTLGGAAQDADIATGGQRRLAAPGQEEGGRAWAHAGRRGGASAPDAECDGVERRRTPGNVGGAGGSSEGLVKGEQRDAVDDRSSTSANSSGLGWGEGRPEPTRSDRGSQTLVRGATATDAASRGRDGRPQDEVREPVERVAASGRGGEARSWGDYGPAVERWERVTGRVAPAPTEGSARNGAQRLSPAFVEWMMGLPEGHVTGETVAHWRERLQARRSVSGAAIGHRGSIARRGPSLTRRDELKALGNGVVPQQAALAVRTILQAEETGS